MNSLAEQGEWPAPGTNGNAMKKNMLATSTRPSLNSDENPYSPPESEFSAVNSPMQTGRQVVIGVLISLQALTLVAGLPIAMFQIESILFSGPILAIAGILLAATAYRSGLYRSAALGASGLGFSLFILALINLNQWSPVAAEKPVPVLAAIYLIASLPLFLVAIREVIRRTQMSPGNSSFGSEKDRVEEINQTGTD